MDIIPVLENPGLSTDKQGRMYLNVAARKMLGCYGIPFQAALAFIANPQTICIAPTTGPHSLSVVDGSLIVTFDAPKGYVTTQKFFKQSHFPRDKKYNYIFFERRNGWLCFRREDELDPITQANLFNKHYRENS